MACLALCATAGPLTLHEKRQGCKKVHFIFARGSTEGGTMGGTVGPAFSRALGTKFGAGNVGTEGVRYPADIAGAFSGGTNPSGSKGAINMAAMAKAVMGRCPNTKIVLGGYSQGAEQVHGALFSKNLGQDGARIAVRFSLSSRFLSVPKTNGWQMSRPR
jgi:cutinase